MKNLQVVLCTLCSVFCVVHAATTTFVPSASNKKQKNQEYLIAVTEHNEKVTSSDQLYNVASEPFSMYLINSEDVAFNKSFLKVLTKTKSLKLLNFKNPSDLKIINKFLDSINSGILSSSSKKHASFFETKKNTIIILFHPPSPIVFFRLDKKTGNKISEGSVGRISCQAKVYLADAEVRMWDKSNKTLVHRNITNFANLNFNIPIATEEYSGDYFCSIKSDLGEAETVTQEYKVTPIGFEVGEPIIPDTVEGDKTAVLECKFSKPDNSSVKITWLLNKTVIPHENEPKLVLSSPTRNSNGNYTCKIKLDKLKKNGTAELIVKFKPEPTDLSLGNQTFNLVIKKNESVELVCDMIGEPEPLIFWKVNTTHDNHISTLLQSNISIPAMYSQEGTYLCSANNTVGPSALNIQYIITIEPDDPTSVLEPTTEIYYLNTGDDVELNCACKNCAPVTYYTWQFSTILDEFRQDIAGNLSEVYVKTKESDNLDKLSIFKSKLLNVTKENEGLYHCYLGYDIGFQINIKVVERPINIVNTTLNRLTPTPVPDYSSYLYCKPQKTVIPIEVSLTADQNVLLQSTESPSSGLLYLESYECDGILYNYSSLDSLTNQIYHVTSEEKIISKDVKNDASVKIVCICNDSNVQTCHKSSDNSTLMVVLFDFNACENLTSNENVSSAGFRVVNETFNSDAIIVTDNKITNLTDNLNGFDGIERISYQSDGFYIISYETPEILWKHEEMYKIIPGMKQVLECTAIGNPVPSTYWTKNNQLVIQNEDVGLPNVLEILAGYASDGGEYQCHAENLMGSTSSPITVVHVTEAPQLKPQNTENFIEYGVSPRNSTFVLECPILNADTIKWEKSLKENLNEPNLTVTIEGNYTCLAENAAGNNNFTYYVYLYSPPKDIVISVNGEEILEDGGEVSLMNKIELNAICTVNGTIVSEISWSKMGADDEISDTGEFNIPITNMESSGVFTCTAENTEGRYNKSFILNIQAPPEILNDSANLTYTAGDDVKLECKSTGNPKPNITWFFNDEELSNIDSEGYEITSVSIDHTYIGKYECRVENEFGIENRTFILDVNYPHHIEAATPNIRKTNWVEPIAIKCIASGKPTPEIVWSFNNKTVFNNDSALYSISSSIVYEPFPIAQVESTLTINSPTYENSDLYTCSSKYEEKVLSDYIQVLIETGPKVDPTARIEIQLFVGRRAEIKCPLYAHPDASYNWLVSGRQPTFGDQYDYDDKGRILIIENVTLTEINAISCSVTNYLGHLGINFHVEIDSFPVLEDPEDKNITVLSGDELSLSCKHSGQPPPLIRWTQYNEEERKELPDTSDILTVKSIDKKTSFVCELTNIYGTRKKIFEVYVNQPPYLEGDAIQDYEIQVGDNLPLYCDVGGLPFPSIIWARKVSGSEGMERLKSEFPKIYNLESAGTHDAGLYICYAQNEFGRIAQRFNIVVLNETNEV